MFKNNKKGLKNISSFYDTILTNEMNCGNVGLVSDKIVVIFLSGMAQGKDRAQESVARSLRKGGDGCW